MHSIRLWGFGSFAECGSTPRRPTFLLHLDYPQESSFTFSSASSFLLNLVTRVEKQRK